MYTAVSAIGVRKGVSKKWEEIALSTPSVASLFQTYRRVEFKLLPGVSLIPVYATLDDFRLLYSTYSGTTDQLMAVIGNTALPTTPTGLVIDKRTAQFKDAFKAGYAVTPVTPSNLESSAIPAEEKTCVRLTRQAPVTSYLNFVEHCLVSVNGLYHLIDTDGVKGVLVNDAMKSLKRSGQNQIGIYSFNNVCAIKQVPLKNCLTEMIAPGQARLSLDEDLTGKSVFLVLGGYLYAFDHASFSQVSDSTFKINFNAMPLLDRYFESNKYLDLSSLPMSSTPANEAQISVADILSDAWLLAYMALSQSFFVILDTPELFLQKQFIKRSGLPEMYISFSAPIYPLVLELGRHPEYWSTLEDGQWSVTIYDNLVANRLYHTIKKGELTSADLANESSNAGRISSAYFLEIGRDV
jgi:hypothetical protein